MHTCEYRKSEFDHNSSLNRHHTTSQYCIDTQKRQGKLTVADCFKCEHCKKTFTLEGNVKTHLKNCKKKPVEKKEKDSDNESFHEEVQPTINIININSNNTNINSNNNISFISQMRVERIQEAFKDFDTTKLLNITQSQLADMVYERLLIACEQSPPSYICKDRSRNKFYYINDENKETEDPDAIMHRKLVSNGIEPINEDIYWSEKTLIERDLAEAIRREDTNKCKSYYAKLKELEKAYQKMDIISDGNEYVSHLSKILPSSYDDQTHPVKLINHRSQTQNSYKIRWYRMKIKKIGRYTIDELWPNRDLYKNTKTKKILNEFALSEGVKNEYNFFLSATEEELVELYGNE